MSNPKLRYRKIAMPKVDDLVVISLSRKDDTRLCIVRSVDGDAFLCADVDNPNNQFERTISSPIGGSKAWGWESESVEAVRLMEASFELEDIPEFYYAAVAGETDAAGALRNMLECHVRPDGTADLDAIAREAIGIVPFLLALLPPPWADLEKKLRWQAQQEVALLKDENIVANTTIVDQNVWRKFRDTSFGTEPTTPEARQLLGLDVATPEPKTVYKWFGNDYYFDDNAVGSVSQIYNGKWVACCEKDDFPQIELTEAEARAWVEAQFNTQK